MFDVLGMERDGEENFIVGHAGGVGVQVTGAGAHLKCRLSAVV